MTLTATVDKNFKVKMINNSLNWTESILSSFNNKEVDKLYQYILDGEIIGKNKARSGGLVGQGINITIPAAVMKRGGVQKGDRFNIKLNIHKREVYLVFDKEGKYKINVKSEVYLPYILVEKKILKINDDTMVRLKDGRIVLKSFSYMQ